MDGLIATLRPSRFAVATIAAALALLVWATLPAPAAAQVFFGFGAPRYYAPWPYYYPPPAYYPYYPAPAYYPPAPAYYPPPASSAAPAPAPAAAAITYTNRPAFTNSAGQTCREYTTTQDQGGRATPIYRTACRDASGQWRVAN